MKQYLLTAQDYIWAFDLQQKEFLQEYFMVRDLIDKGYGKGEIIKITKISKHRIYNWMRKEKRIPSSVKSFLKAQERGYFSINKNSVEAENLAYLTGYNLGDGNIHRGVCNTWFYGHSDDLPIFNKLLENFHVLGKIHIYKIHNGKMCVSDNSFARFMSTLGCPIGDKTKSRFLIPKWILQSKNKSEIKRKFLQGLFDSELSNPTLTKSRFSFQSLKFYNIKSKELTNQGIEYLQQIRTLLLEFNVISANVKVDREYTRSRDNERMIQLYFIIYSNYINLHNFIANVGFLYNAKRVNQTMKYKGEIETNAKKELGKIKNYEKALLLRKQGLSAYVIAKKLNLPIYHAKNWLYRKNKPMQRYYSLNN